MPIVSLVQNKTAADPMSHRAVAVTWKLQAYGLVAITLLSFFPRFFHFQEYAFFFLLAVALCLSWAEKTNPVVRTPIDLPLLGFVAWVLCTVPFAIDPAYSFSEWRKLVTQVLVFYWSMLVLHRHRQTDLGRLLVWAVIGGSLALSVFALGDFVLRGGTWKDRLVRAGAPSSDYNWLTTYLVLVIPILIGWCLIQRTMRERRLGLLSLFAAGIAQIAAYTRAGWAAHVVQAIAFGIMAGRQRLVIWILVGAIAMGGGVLAASEIGYQRETIDPWTLSARVKTWQLGFHQVVQHPIFGVGYGNDTFLKVFAAEVEAEKGKGAVEKVLPALHNTFAMVLMGSGVPAVALFVWVLVRIIRRLTLRTRGVQLRQNGFLLLAPAIALAVVGFVVRNIFDYMFAGSLASLFWILVAFGFSIKDGPSSEVDQNEATSLPRTGKGIIASVVLSSFFLVGIR